MIALLIAHGARTETDVVDKLWGGTPVGWAWHARNQAVVDYLNGIEAG